MQIYQNTKEEESMMKKMLSVGLILAMVLSLAACTGKSKEVGKDDEKRSEERRVGKECLRLCRSRWSPYH